MADGLQGGLRTSAPESGSKRASMTDEAHPTPSRSGGRLDPMQIVFWAAVALGVAAAGVAITSGPSVGQAGAILLLLVVASGMVLFLWMSRGAGKRFGPFPERGAIAAAAFSSGRTDFAMLDALDEAALITDKALSPICANAAYIAIMEDAGMLGESDRPPVRRRSDAVGANVPLVEGGGRRPSAARRIAGDRRAVARHASGALRSQRRPNGERPRAVAAARTRCA